MDQFLGQIILWAGNFAPKGWAFCNGQLLPTQQNQALFSILGTAFGGDGINNFALPDLRGRLPIHSGASQSPNLTYVPRGAKIGTAEVTLIPDNLPSHTHLTIKSQSPQVNFPVSTGDDEDTGNPVGAYLKTGADGTYANSADAVMGPIKASVNVQNAGANQPVPNMGPTLTLNYCIALSGLYPSRP